MGNFRSGVLTTNTTINFFTLSHLFYLPFFCLLFFQLEVLKHYLDGGRNIFVMLGEGGETKYDTNINFLLEEFGIMVNNGA